MRQTILVVFLLLGIFTSACTTTPAISNMKAVEIATGACKEPRLVMISEPEDIRTQLITLKEADQLIMKDIGAANYGLPINTLVWLVAMDGQFQLIGGPPPPNTPIGQISTITPPPIHRDTCYVVIDANTGRVIFRRG